MQANWQIWVEVGQRPIPRKMVITSKTINSAPQYTLRVKGWNTRLRRDGPLAPWFDKTWQPDAIELVK